VPSSSRYSSSSSSNNKSSKDKDYKELSDYRPITSLNESVGSKNNRFKDSNSNLTKATIAKDKDN